MKNIIKLLSLFIISTVATTALFSQTIPFVTGARIAISQDGNYHDRDDITDVGISAAILSKAGVIASVVFWGTSDHYWFTTASQELAMQTSASGGFSRFGPFANAQIFNVRTSHIAAVNALTAVINASTANSPLLLLENGPAQIEGEAIAAANPNVLQYVTIYSQSEWNDYHPMTVAARTEGIGCPRYAFNMFECMGANLVHIKDQNTLLSTTKDKFYWMRDSSDPNLQWLFGRNEVAFPAPKTKFDCSGSGLVYYVITGDDSCSPTKLQTYLTQ